MMAVQGEGFSPVCLKEEREKREREKREREKREREKRERGKRERDDTHTHRMLMCTRT